MAGTLRIFQPRQKGFKPDDILLEVQLDAPIIQVAAGRCHTAGFWEGFFLVIFDSCLRSILMIQIPQIESGYLVLTEIIPSAR